MKIKVTFITLSLLLFYFFTNFKKYDSAPCTLTLTNAKTNKSIKLCDKITSNKIEFTLGVSQSVDRETPDKGEEPLVIINYDGLIIEMQNDLIKNVTITSKKWKLNTFTIGTSIDLVTAKHEKIETKYFNDWRFKIKDSNAVLYAETDDAKKVKKIGVVFN